MANLTFTGKIEHVSRQTTEISKKGDEFTKQFIIVSEDEGQYPNKMKFDLIKKDEVKNQVGEVVTVHYNAGVREYNSGYFQSLNVWKIEAKSSPTQQATISQNESPF